jgi:hypothetical protein
VRIGHRCLQPMDTNFSLRLQGVGVGLTLRNGLEQVFDLRESFL